MELDWRKQEYKKRPGKSACVVRYGGFGDMIQASSVYACLKKQGYHVTANTTDHGYKIIKNDPNVDEFLIQGTDQVPNNELVSYWHRLSECFERFINLSEIVEGGLLAVPGRREYLLDKEERHALMNKNYLEAMHEHAGLPPEFGPRFYPTPSEKARAMRRRNKILYNKRVPDLGGSIILWSLSGSSVHKIWAYVDHVIAWIMLNLNARVVLVGDNLCQALEVGWEMEPRVVCRSGRWSIRDTLAFAEVCDLVIGTETGVLNAVGFLDVPKICLLSHSTEENLTKHWKNTAALTPEECPCYPCHQLHYGFRYCNRDHVTGMALCSSNIGPDRVIKEISRIYGDRRDIPATVQSA